MRIGILGCGFIGSTIAAAADHIDEVCEIYLYDRSLDATRELKSRLTKSRVVESVEKLIEKADLVVEAASQNAVHEYALQILEGGKDIVILSVGALVDEELWSGLKKKAREKGAQIFIPSGAIAGLDGVNAAATSSISSVEIRTTKPVEGLRGVKYLDEKGIDMNEIDNPTVVFQGTAQEAVRLFPKNINVSATLSLAALGFEETKVTITADPSTTRNTHEITVSGRFGKLTCSVENVPSMTNPKTSYLASLAGISLIKKIATGVWIGS